MWVCGQLGACKGKESDLLIYRMFLLYILIDNLSRDVLLKTNCLQGKKVAELMIYTNTNSALHNQNNSIVLKGLVVLLVIIFTLCEHSNQVIIEESAPFVDAEGNVYKTLKINNQVWLAENLRTTIYNDGTPIMYNHKTLQDTERIARYYIFDNRKGDIAFINRIGILYNWYAASSKKIAPEGWHVPTQSEWSKLWIYCDNNPGANILQEFSKSMKGFSGYRDVKGIYYGVYRPFYSSNWWSSSDADDKDAYYFFDDHYYSFAYELVDGVTKLKTDYLYDKRAGFSIRLVKD